MRTGERTNQFDSRRRGAAVIKQRLVDELARRRDGFVCLEGIDAREEDIEDHAARPHIAGKAELVAEHFRWHVKGGA